MVAATAAPGMRSGHVLGAHVLDVRTRHSAHGEVLQFTQCYNRGEVDWLGWLSNDAPCCIGYKKPFDVWAAAAAGVVSGQGFWRTYSKSA